jgi:hypothetical protein
VGRKRVARLMLQPGLKGAQKRRFRCTTRSGARERWAPDLVDRQFVANRPNALWLADVTFVPTAEGFLYLAVVLDVFSRLIVGWAMEAPVGSKLVLAALEMAYAQRRPQQVIHHSDHGSELEFNWSSQHSWFSECNILRVFTAVQSDAHAAEDRHSIRSAAPFKLVGARLGPRFRSVVDEGNYREKATTAPVVARVGTISYPALSRTRSRCVPPSSTSRSDMALALRSIMPR